jgi:Rhomboid family
MRAAGGSGRRSRGRCAGGGPATQAVRAPSSPPEPRHKRVMVLFPPIAMPARMFVLVFTAIELFLGVTGTQEGVAHFAHLGGMIDGFALLRYWRGSGGGRRVIR